MPQRDVDNYGYREKTSVSEREREYNLVDPKDITFKMSDETNRFIVELSKKPLADLIEEHEQNFQDSIFGKDSYTDVERTSMFTGLDLGIKVGVGVSLKAGFLVDNITGKLGFRTCLEFSRSVGVGLSVWEFNPNAQGSVPENISLEIQNQVEVYAALGLGIKVTTDLNSKAEASMVIGAGYGGGTSSSICLDQRVRFEEVRVKHSVKSPNKLP